jgi:hypothetical protein
MTPERERPRSSTGPARRWLLAAMLGAVLAGGLGFAYKIVQFAREAMGEDGGAFAVPVLVYGGMAVGFICLLGWAATRGMFHDVERPKLRLLEREEEYERHGI